LVVAIMAIAGVASAQTTTMIATADGPNGSHDDWNLAANWDAGIPTGAMDAVVSAGLYAECWNDTTPVYTGGLTLLNNSTLQLGWGNPQRNLSINALDGSITMNEGSAVRLRMATNLDLPPITLAGDGASVHQSPSTSAHHRTRNFAAVTGAYDFTIIGNNNNTANLNEVNTFTSLIANADDRWHLRGKVAGSLGLGDVTINRRTDGRSASLYIDAADAMASTATLNLNGLGYSGNGSDRLVMNASQTVNELWIDGTQAPAGTYDVSQTWIKTGSTGILTVSSGPAVADPTVTSWANDVFDGPIYQDSTVVNYSVVFSNDMDDTTFSAADFGNAGTATGWSIGTIEKTVTPALPNAPSEFDIEVLLASPSAGTLQLQVNESVDLKDVLGTSVDTSSAIIDPIAITINAGATPPSTITGTIGGPNGSHDTWNEPTNWDNGIPFGAGSAIVAAGVTAECWNLDTPAYSGGLTLEAGATLQMGWTTSYPASVNAMGTGPITMQDATQIRMRLPQTVDVPAITLDAEGGSAEVHLSPSTSAHGRTRNFDGEISGTGDFKIRGNNRNIANMNAANTFDGDLIFEADDRWKVYGKVAGAFGTGDVIVNQRGDQITPNRSAQLFFDVPDLMADTATLWLNGPEGGGGYAGDGINWVMINHEGSETIAGLMLYGLALDEGTYLPADEIWLGGVGSLIVAAPDPDMPGDANGNGFVDDDDLAILLSNWEQDPGTITTWELGDFTGNTDVDDDDLAVLLGNWTGPPPGGAAVPEPATLALLGLGGLSMLRRRRK